MKKQFNIERYEQSLRHMGVTMPKPIKAFFFSSYDLSLESYDTQMYGIMIIHSLVHKGIIK